MMNQERARDNSQPRMFASELKASMAKIRFKKLRLWMMYPIFIAYPFVARITPFSYIAGAMLMLLGLGIRFWASGHISKSRLLATSGPYAYIRNPLYVGNFILGLGIAVIPNNIWLLLYYMITFTVLYIGTIKEEQENLEEKFGQAYRDYVTCVPAFLPYGKAYKNAEKKRFDIHQSFKNGEFIRLCGFLILLIFIYLWWSFVLKREPFGKDNVFALFLFVVFLLLLWFNISIRRKNEARGRV